MGGSDHRGRSLGDTSKLEERAKEILKQGSGKCNVFISFAFEDIDEVNLLRAHAKNENSDIEFNDRSVHEPYDSTRADYIREKLSDRMNQCSTTVIYLSEATASSEWVTWEVTKSLEMGKRVIAVHASDSPPSRIPDVIRANNIEIIPWSKLADRLR